MQTPFNEQRRNLLSLASLALWPPLLSSCGGAAVAVVPFITFAFEGVFVADGAGTLQVAQLNLDPNGTQQGKSSGTLDSATLATSDINGNSVQRIDISGSFSGNDLSLTVPGAVAPLATAYTGQFTAADTIVLTPATSGRPALRLLRVDNSFRPSLDGSTWTGKNAQGAVWTMRFSAQSIGLAAELLTGTDVLGGQAGTLTGYAEMRELQITIVRGATSTPLTGVLGPAGTTPPGSAFLESARTITFPDGSSLTRDP